MTKLKKIIVALAIACVSIISATAADFATPEKEATPTPILTSSIEAQAVSKALVNAYNLTLQTNTSKTNKVNTNVLVSLVVEGKVSAFYSGILANTKEAGIVTQTPSAREYYELVKQVNTVDKHVIGSNDFGPIYLVVDSTKSERWSGFQHFVLSDAGQAIVMQCRVKPVQYSERSR